MGDRRRLDKARKITRFYGVIIYYDVINWGSASIGKYDVLTGWISVQRKKLHKKPIAIIVSEVYNIGRENYKKI